jgi:flagellar motor switch protein FliN/FliY
VRRRNLVAEKLRSMPKISPTDAPQVAQSVAGGAAETAEALSRAFGQSIVITGQEPATLEFAELGTKVSGPGLVVAFKIEETGAALLVPEASGLLPPWCAQPDTTGVSKLTTLAQELGMTLLPESFMPSDSKAGYVRSMAAALGRAGILDGAIQIPIALTGGDGKPSIGYLVWPLRNPAMLLGGGSQAKPAAAALPKPAAPPAPKPAASARPATAPRQLPSYSKSLLRIRVPVTVTLAQKKQSLRRIVELGPGSILQFDKSCEEMLELEVADKPIAVGEAVKVGDKFGLRVTSIVLPDERFRSVGSREKKS